MSLESVLILYLNSLKFLRVLCYTFFSLQDGYAAFQIFALLMQ